MSFTPRRHVAVIIPALDEAASISSVTRAVIPFADPIVVDDGSSDGTGELALAAGAIVVRHETNLGYDAALESGFARAAALGYEQVVTLDGDGQHDPAAIVRFASALSSGAEVVVGRRPHTQRIAEKLFSVVTGTLWGVRDPLCGMKGYRLRLYIEAGHFDSYGSVGTELLLRALRSRRCVAEIPVAARHRIGHPRFGAGIRANYLITRALLLGLVKARAIEATHR